MTHGRVHIVGLVAFVVFVLLAASAEAVKLRRPYHPARSFSYGFDNNYGAAGCSDYNCGDRCYNGHTGIDFPLGYGTTVLAAASGRVVRVVQGCADYGYLGNTCGARCGNYVSIDHDDGTNTIYCHMRNGSIPVREGQRVSCGQEIGQSASSGNSTGPHLHLGWRHAGSRKDVYRGRCSSSPGGWVDQGGYWDPPGSACESTCECSPGARESRGCGRCGSQERVCGGNCQWGGWSGCSGQGPCSPGDAQREDCCDCGSRTRSCTGSCEWGSWSECSGPDPADEKPCATGLPGVCADGTERCVGGCITCVENIPASDEVCDDLDNDCDGAVDDGEPPIGDAPPPALAARLVDVSMPPSLAAGEVAQAWVVFENVGTDAWAPGDIVLRVEGDTPEDIARWHDPSTWWAWDVPARLDERVEPGEVARLAFQLRGPDGREPSRVDVRLAGPDGAPLMCPRPAFGVLVGAVHSDGVATRGVGIDGFEDEEATDGDPYGRAAGGCATTRTSGSAPAGLLLPLVALGWLRRRANA